MSLVQCKWFCQWKQWTWRWWMSFIDSSDSYRDDGVVNNISRIILFTKKRVRLWQWWRLDSFSCKSWKKHTPRLKSLLLHHETRRQMKENVHVRWNDRPQHYWLTQSLVWLVQLHHNVPDRLDYYFVEVENHAEVADPFIQRKTLLANHGGKRRRLARKESHLSPTLRIGRCVTFASRIVWST
jgi:hypothetical protein